MLRNISKFFSVLFLVLLIIFSACQPDEEPKPDVLEAREIIDLSYGDHPRHKMDVFLPANRSKENTRLLIWIHGGAWIDGDKGEFVNFKPWFEAVQENYAYVSLNYRLFDVVRGTDKFPAQEEDIIMAMNFIKSKLSEWQVSEQVILSGGSAGGHLALLHSYKHNQDGFVKVTAAVFPPTELLTVGAVNPVIDLLMRQIIGSPQSNRQQYLDASPINFVTSQSVPTTFFHGDADNVVPIAQSYSLEDKLKEFGVPYYREYYPGQGHGFSDATNRNMIAQIERFINEQL